MDSYSKVLRVVTPKRQRAAALDRAVSGATDRLTVTRDRLAGVTERVRQMEAKVVATREEKERLGREIELTHARLRRAHRLVDELGGESGRWKERIRVLEGQKRYLVGDSFVGAAFVSHLGPFGDSVRQGRLSKWLGRLRGGRVAVSADFTVHGVLGDSVEVSGG